MSETVINRCDRGDWYISSDEARFINLIWRLARTHPEEVTILREPAGNDGCIYARVVGDRWVKIAPPCKREYSVEERQKMAERMKNISKMSKNRTKEGECEA